jgi:hypothetical protein
MNTHDQMHCIVDPTARPGGHDRSTTGRAAVLALGVALVTGCLASEDEPITTFAENPATDEAAHLFSWDRIERYEITMLPEVRQQMLDSLESPHEEDWETYFPAELSFQGQTYANVAIRYKGDWGTLTQCQLGLILCDKLSIKLKFSEYDESGVFFGLERLNFHAMQSDRTRLNEVLAYSLFRDLQVPAPRAAFASLSLNGEDWGLFALVEQIDGEFVESRFSSGDGLLYKEVWPSNLDLADADRILESKLETARDREHSVALFTEFASATQEMTDETYTSVMSRWFDLDAFVRYMVVDRFIENFDGPVAFYCFDGLEGCINHNFYIYSAASGTRHFLIPWDLDLAFPAEPNPYGKFYKVPPWNATRSCERIPTVTGNYIRPAGCDPILGGFIANQWTEYTGAMRAALADSFALPRLHERVDLLAGLIRPAIASDPTSSLRLPEWEQRVATFKQELAALHDFHLQSVQAP